MSASAEARVNGKYLNGRVNETVRLTAKVVQINGDRATVEASDGQQVTVLLSRDMHIEDPYVEIIGTIKEDRTLKALTSINMGKNLDMAAVNAVVELFNSHTGAGVMHNN